MIESHRGGLPSPDTPAEISRADRPYALVYRRFVMAGFDAKQAGNLSARMAGLAPVRSSWRPHEIEALCFLRRLVDDGRLTR